MPALMYVGARAYIEKDGLVLIAKRALDHPHGGGGEWEPPSGRLEAGESLEEGLAREVMEETGLEIQIIAPFNTWCVPHHMIGVGFVCEYVSGKVRLTSEHTEYRWVPTDDLVKYGARSSTIEYLKHCLEWRSRV